MGQQHHRCDYFLKPSGSIILRCFWDIQCYNDDYFTIITIIGPTISRSDASPKSNTRGCNGQYAQLPMPCLLLPSPWMNRHNFPGGQGDAGAVGQGGGVLNLDGMRLSINYFPDISFACLLFNIKWRAQEVVLTLGQADYDKWMVAFASFCLVQGRGGST